LLTFFFLYLIIIDNLLILEVVLEVLACFDLQLLIRDILFDVARDRLKLIILLLDLCEDRANAGNGMAEND
jgi:hypothetical protein